MTEREVLLTGVGGQGIQLAAQTLARAATRDGRNVMMFGQYGGEMRGGNSGATLVVGDETIDAPPIVSDAWSALAMHHQFWGSIGPKLRADACIVVNSTLFEADLGPAAHRVDVPATEIAGELGNTMTASMVLVGAYIGVTELVEIDSAVAGMEAALPEYRRAHVPANAQALRAGFEATA